MSDGTGATSVAPTIPTSPSPAQVESTCEKVETWAQKCDDIPTIKETADKLAAIDEYLARTSTAGRARVAAAQRRLEVRIGQLLPKRQGRRTDQLPNHGKEVDDGLDGRQRAEFRAMADDADTVEEVINGSTDDEPASRRKVVNGIKTKTKTETKKSKTPPKGEPLAAGRGPVYDSKVIDWVRGQFECGMTGLEISEATRGGDSGWFADRWPKGMSEGTVLNIRATIYHLRRYEEANPPKRRPRYSGARLREIAARPKPLTPFDKVQRTVMQLTAALESVEIDDYDLAASSYTGMLADDLYDDLTEHLGWVEKTFIALQRHVSDQKQQERLRKMRENHTGRTPAEIEAFEAAADRIERLQHRRLG